jgi:hypothetical protein
MGFSSAPGSKAVGDELAAVLPKIEKPWWKRMHLVKLNLCILSLLMLCKQLHNIPTRTGH